MAVGEDQVHAAADGDALRGLNVLRQHIPALGERQLSDVGAVGITGAERTVLQIVHALVTVAESADAVCIVMGKAGTEHHPASPADGISLGVGHGLRRCVAVKDLGGAQIQRSGSLGARPMADGLGTRSRKGGDSGAADRDGTGVFAASAADGRVAVMAGVSGEKLPGGRILPPYRQGIALGDLDALGCREGRAVAEDQIHVPADRDAVGDRHVSGHGVPAAVGACGVPGRGGGRQRHAAPAALVRTLLVHKGMILQHRAAADAAEGAVAGGVVGMGLAAFDDHRNAAVPGIDIPGGEIRPGGTVLNAAHPDMEIVCRVVQGQRAAVIAAVAVSDCLGLAIHVFTGPGGDPGGAAGEARRAARAVLAAADARCAAAAGDRVVAAGNGEGAACAVIAAADARACVAADGCDAAAAQGDRAAGAVGAAADARAVAAHVEAAAGTDGAAGDIDGAAGAVGAAADARAAVDIACAAGGGDVAAGDGDRAADGVGVGTQIVSAADACAELAAGGLDGSAVDDHRAVGAAAAADARAAGAAVGGDVAGVDGDEAVRAEITAADAGAAVAARGCNGAAVDDDIADSAPQAAADAGCAAAAGGIDRAAGDMDRFNGLTVFGHAVRAADSRASVAAGGIDRAAGDRDRAAVAALAAADAGAVTAAVGRDRAAVDRDRAGPAPGVQGAVFRGEHGFRRRPVAAAADARRGAAAADSERAAVDREDAARLLQIAADAGAFAFHIVDDQRPVAAALAPDRQGVAAGEMDALGDGEGRAVAEDQVHVPADLHAAGDRHAARHGVPARRHGRRGAGDRREALTEELVARCIHVGNAGLALEGSGQGPVSVRGEAVDRVRAQRRAVLRPAQEAVAGVG